MATKRTVSAPLAFKLRRTLKGHSGVINRIAWSPDGKRIASTSDDATVRIWEGSTGKEVRVFLPFRGSPGIGPRKTKRPQFPALREGTERKLTYSIAWSPDGSMLAAGSEDGLLRVWHTKTEKELWRLRLKAASAGELDWSPDGQTLAAACSDSHVRLINTQSGKLIHEISHHAAPVPTIAWSPDGRTLATGSWDTMILLLDATSWAVKSRLEGHSDRIWDLAWAPSGNIIASASADKTIRIWDPHSGRQIAILEGHTKPIRGVSFSYDGRFLASKSADEVRLWRSDNNEMVALLSEPSDDTTFVGLAFHPKTRRLATLGADNKNIRIWTLDYDALSRPVQSAQSTRYANAKVVLVGDTGVGKSGLALVLTGKPWEETGSTHGRRVWVLDNQEAETQTGLKQTRETLLWDLAGQPDYRLIHQLHLTEVAVALVVFDSRSQTDPFSGVRHWDRAIRQAERVQSDSIPPTKKYLVSARVDVGRIGVSPTRIEELRRSLGFDGYFETSAKEGWGVDKLSDEIRTAINWDALPAVSSTELFQSIKSFLVKEKESGRLLSSMDDLYRAFLRTQDTSDENSDLRAEFETCIGRVESRGLIQRLSFGNLILLQPELQDVYASAIANAVKDEPDGLGCIREDKARAGDFRIPEGERIKDIEHEKLLLISTVEDLLRHEIALREQGEDGQYLVFPSQLTRENPDLPDPEGKAVIFNFEGPVLNIYATLAVRLSYSGVFKKKEMWKNAATYSSAGGGICGMFLREVNEGRGELVLFFDPSTTEEIRYQFEEYIRIHLQRRALPETINRRRIFGCNKCGTPVSDLSSKRRRERGFDWISCNVCEPPSRISLLDREERLITDKASRISEMDRAADTQRELETAASVLQGKIATKDFDVFLCHNSADKTSVKAVGERLKERGILPWLDEWELRPGLPWQRLLEEQIARIKAAAVFVGKDAVGPWQRQELDAFLREFVDRDCPVIPVVLKDSPRKPALPIFLKGMTWVDFRKESPKPLEQLIWGITGERQSGGEYQV